MFDISKLEVNSDLIERIENKSDGIINRARIYFKNGYQLSVIIATNGLSYGGEEGLFEIAVFRGNEILDYFVDSSDKFAGDEVLGNLTSQDVVKYINEVGSLVPAIELKKI